jgi:hypothetical protein
MAEQNNGQAQGQETKEKVPFKERVKARLDQPIFKEPLTPRKVIKTVAIVAAVPIAFFGGKALADRRNQSMLETTSDEPKELPCDENYVPYESEALVDVVEETEEI